jgi:hypothetical protein
MVADGSDESAVMVSAIVDEAGEQRSDHGGSPLPDTFPAYGFRLVQGDLKRKARCSHWEEYQFEEGFDERLRSLRKALGGMVLISR